MKWKSVKDRLPEGIWHKSFEHLSEEVLIANNVAIAIGFYNRKNGNWYVDEPADGEWINGITHWMPLPKNPHAD